VNYPRWNVWRVIFALYMVFPTALIISMYGKTSPSYIIGINTIVACFGISVVPAIMGYYLAKWEPVDELEAESWRRKK
jgi:hypothetical protein